MTMFYTARHAAPRAHRSAAQRTGAGVLAATALGLGASTMTATSASANGGPTTPVEQTSTSTASAPSASTGSFTDIVREGDRGSIVEQIQDEVGVTADGVFGPETTAAVSDWQSEQALAADGVVGPETGSAMGLTGGSTTSTPSASTESTGSTVEVAQASTGASSSVVDTARGYVGSPYVMGGEDPSGFDCSGFVQYVYEQATGKDLPRTTTEQQAAATPVSDPQPGDIVFFGNPAYHNGIYAGDGKIIDAGNSSTGVTERDIWTDDVSYGRF